MARIHEFQFGMIFEIFQNGSDKVNRRLLIIELALSQAAITIAAIQGFLPSQDWIPATYLRPLAGGLALLAILMHAGALFFNKTAALYKQSRDDIETKTETALLEKKNTP